VAEASHQWLRLRSATGSVLPSSTSGSGYDFSLPVAEALEATLARIFVPHAITPKSQSEISLQRWIRKFYPIRPKNKFIFGYNHKNK